MKFASRCLESSLAHWVKCTYGELRSVLGLLQKISWCAKVGHKLHLFQQHNFPLTFIKVWLTLIQKNKDCYLSNIEESPENEFFDNTKDLSLTSFWYHSRWHQEVPLGYIVFIFPNVYLAVMLQAPWHIADLQHQHPIVFITFWAFLMVNQTFLSLQVKGNVINLYVRVDSRVAEWL